MFPCKLLGLRSLWITIVTAAMCACGPNRTVTDAGTDAEDHASMDSGDAVRLDVSVDTPDVSATDARDLVTPPDATDAPIHVDASDARDAWTSCVSAGCPPGAACCVATGVCYNPACLSCCLVSVDSGVPDVTAPCFINAECDPSAYCAGSGCGTAGTCVAMPAGCPDVYDPVCGCDGTTYGNACEAAMAGERVEYSGECTTADGGVAPCASDLDCSPGLACCTSTGICYDTRCLACCRPSPGGCIDNTACGRSEYCEGTGCGTPGACAPMPSICPSIYDPVCGCDGNTYSNSCVANAAGQRVASAGPCG